MGISAGDRIEWLDTLRGSAALMVILLHAAAPYVMMLDPGSAGWQHANWIDAGTRTCVPIFFMLSGYLFLGNRAPEGKHLLRLLAALVFYSVLALPMAWILRGGDLGLNSIGTTPVFYHLWFFYSIPAIYLFAMLVQIRVPSGWVSLLPLLAMLLLLNPSMLDMLLGDGAAAGPAFLVGKSVMYMLYAIAGAQLGRIEIPEGGRLINALRLCLPMLMFVCIVSIAALTARVSVEAGSYVATFYSYTHVLNVIVALSLFLWVRTVCLPTWIGVALSAVASRSLSIYGIHALVLALFTHAARHIDAPVAVEIIGTFLMTLALSYLIAGIIGRLDPRGWVS